ncbi:MIP/aquaporin family protein [Pedobacter ginsengisoli]|uniref:MIP/aquaporin family protein n=1 Tax=Pedobacter ginsengisoli TaxID=363852 RepID=UPI00254CE739|nr:MIP/aquaporin family protein [Pedobacter ginsengisoli]
MSPFSAEIIGTMFMILLGNGVVANVVLNGTKGNNSGWMVITTAWAFAVFVGVVIAGPYSGAHLNPAVTVGLALADKFNWALVPTYIAGQFIGAMAGAFLVWLFYKDFYAGTPDQGAKQATFCTAPAIPNTVSNLISEIIGTFVLIFVIYYFTDAKMGADNTPIGLGSIGALPVAILVWVIGLSLGGTTGYAINPARDLGPRIMHAILPVAGKGGSNWGYAWIPVAGPLIGCAIAAFFFHLMK